MTGPAAAISVLVCQVVNTHGLAALPIITVGVGALQLACGVANAGWLVKLTPIPVIAGFTTGVGVLISVGQLPRVLALPPAAADASAFEILRHVLAHAGAADPTSLAVAALSFAVVYTVPKLHKKAGGMATLAAVAAGTVAAPALASAGFGTVALVGPMPPLMLSDLLKLPSAADLMALLPTTVLVFALTSVESLLSCAAIDKMRPTSYKHDPSQELIGQGLANLAAGCCSGLPVTSVIARSTLNVQSGGQTRLPGALQGLATLGGLGALAPLIALVPMPALAAVLVNAASKMLWPPEIVHAVRVQRTDALPYGVTVLGMLTLGLAEGCILGVCTSLVFSGANWNQPQTAWLSFEPAQSVRTSLELYSAEKLYAMDKERLVRLVLSNYEKDLHFVMGSYVTPDDLDQTCPECGGEGILQVVMTSYTTPDNLDEGVECQTCGGSGVAPSATLPAVWWLNGPLNFLSVFRIAELVEAVKRSRPDHGRCIFDLHGCRALDLTGAEALLDGLSELQKDGVKVTLMNAPEEFQGALTACAGGGEQIDVYAQAAYALRRPVLPGRDLDLEAVLPR